MEQGSHISDPPSHHPSMHEWTGSRVVHAGFLVCAWSIRYRVLALAGKKFYLIMSNAVGDIRSDPLSAADQLHARANKSST